MSSDSYRAQLEEFIREKSSKRSFSFRQLAAKAGFRSPNYIQKVLSGEKNLSLEAARKLCDALQVQGDARETFLESVLLAQASLQGGLPVVQGEVERRRLERRFTSLAQSVPQTQNGLFRSWLTPIVWTFAPILKTRQRCLMLERLSSGLISSLDVERALDALLKEGLIQCDPQTGEFSHATRVLQIKTQAAPETLKKFYVSCLSAAKRCVAVLPSEKRNVRVTTLAVDSRKLPELHERVRAFHKELVSWLVEEGNPNTVVQLSTVLGVFGPEEST